MRLHGSKFEIRAPSQDPSKTDKRRWTDGSLVGCRALPEMTREWECYKMAQKRKSAAAPLFTPLQIGRFRDS